jgi:uncharacterized protein
MVTQTVPIYTGQDFYVPAFEVRIGQHRLARDVVRDITQVTYKDNIEQFDSFEIVINNWDAETRTFKYIDTDQFDPGKKVELYMGYYGKNPLRLMITGEITSLRPAFPASGQPTLTITGLNLMHRLRTKQESVAYENRTDSQIATEIGARLGIKVDTKPGNETAYPYLFQHNQYDIIFLMERARRIGYDLFVIEPIDGSPPRLYFGPSDTIKLLSYQLTYSMIQGAKAAGGPRFPSLIQFQPELTTANQVSKVAVQGWDAKNKKPISVEVSRAELATKGVGEQGGQKQIDASFDQRKEIIASKPITSEEEARTLARETLQRIAKDMVKGTGATVGLPDLRAGSVVQIDGLGRRFSGRYFVTGTTHAIGDSGYTTQFECRREELQ